MRHLLAPVALLACMTASCASAPPERQASSTTTFTADGVVAAEVVDTPSDQRYVMQPGEQFLREIPKRENARPLYPAALLAAQLDPVSVIARLVVNSSGQVERAEIVESTTEIAEFSESVLVAVRTWTFIPLQRVHGSKLEALPFTQDYRFTFRQENGRAVVVQGSSRDS